MNDIRVPPHDLDAEAAVLSAVMLDSSALDKCVAVGLTPEKFYAERHRRIFEGAIECAATGIPTDVVNIGTWLKDRERIAQVGGMSYMTELLNAAPAVANVAAYAKTIVEKSAVRALIATCQKLAAKGYLDYGDPRAFVDEAETAVHSVAQSLTMGIDDTFAHVRKAMSDAVREVQKGQGSKGVTGTRTGLDDLDQLTTGLHGGELTVIAGRPGMGKSSLAFQIAGHVALGGLGAVGSSLEMPSKLVALRLACAAARVSGSRARAGGFKPDEWSRFSTAASDLAKAPLWLDERAGASVAQIRATVRRAARECEKRQTKLGVVVVDYLQLARGQVQRGRVSNREQEVSEISRSMKEIAKEHDVPVLALSQLNRSCETRADKRPLLSDLRESGSIEQDADVVLFVYRDKVYNAQSERGNVAELIVAKQRSGPCAAVDVMFDEATTSFRNLARDDDFGGEWQPEGLR